MSSFKRIFLISPVARITPEENARIEEYVDAVEDAGDVVHWPIRDTKQVDATGGYDICTENFTRIIEADEIHIWYNETSGGSKFDMGGVFMLIGMMGWRKRIFIVNDAEIGETSGKNLLEVMRNLIAQRNLS